MAKLILGIDLGGSSSKATLIDESGAVVSTSTKEYASFSPYEGWLEQDADEVVEAAMFNIRACLSDPAAQEGQVAAVAVDAATHMAVLCDQNDQPLRRFIHWSDSRSSRESKELLQEYGEVLSSRTVNRIGTAWTLPQLLWLKRNEPEVLEKTTRIYFLKDYVRHKLTGDFCTDYIEAMGAMLANDMTMQWDEELCCMVGLDMSILPEIKNPTDIAGRVSVEAARLTGLPEGTPVIVGTTDTALEVYAAGAIRPGCATIKLATAGRICPITQEPIMSHQFFNYRHVIPGLWYPGTGTKTCAASYKWYRDLFGDVERMMAAENGGSAYELLNRAAEEVPPGSEKLFFHPYLLGEMTPYFDNSLRGSFTGIGMHHTKGHFTRAVMEGISYSMRDCLEEVKKQNISINEYRLIGGGAKGTLWRQILADILGEPLVLTSSNDSSMGSAMLAGVATGIFRDFEESVDRCVAVTGIVTPDPQAHAFYEKGFETYRNIQKALEDIYHQINGEEM